MEYHIIALQNCLKDTEFLQNILENYSCPLNSDVEYFLKSKAVDFEKKHFSRTYFVFQSDADNLVLSGYFTLALKGIDLRSGVSNRLKKVISGYSNKSDSIVYLIGQLGKNFSANLNISITGSELMEMALGKIDDAQRLVGGRAVIVECKDDCALTSFYESLGLERLSIDNQNGLLTYMGNVGNTH